MIRIKDRLKTKEDIEKVVYEYIDNSKCPICNIHHSFEYVLEKSINREETPNLSDSEILLVEK